MSETAAPGAAAPHRSPAAPGGSGSCRIGPRPTARADLRPRFDVRRPEDPRCRVGCVWPWVAAGQVTAFSVLAAASASRALDEHHLRRGERSRTTPGAPAASGRNCTSCMHRWPVTPMAVFLAAREPGGFAMFFQPPDRAPPGGPWASTSTSPCRGDPGASEVERLSGWARRTVGTCSTRCRPCSGRRWPTRRATSSASPSTPLHAQPPQSQVRRCFLS